MYSIVKRIFDIIASSAALIVLAPLLIPISIALRLTGEGYVFYLQQRVGYKNKIFSIFKFATMLKDSPNLPGGIITSRNDPRMTPLGPLLRKTKINELPQLLNILRGDMSFVGPRPVMKKSFDVYPSHVQETIYNVVPGLTGIGSIVFRDEEELLSTVKESGGDSWMFYTEKIYPFKGELEKWYQANQSIFTDFKIIIATAWVIVFPNSNKYQTWFSNLPTRNF